MVYPLITKSDGTKFGKSETGAVWLSAERTSPYRFYQYWLNTDDRDVITYLKFFTFLDRVSILGLENALAERPEQREAHRELAREMTRLLHGQHAVAAAEKASQVLFGGEISGVDAKTVEEIFADVPSCDIPKTQFEGAGLIITDLLVQSGLASSRGDGRRLIAGGGIYLNNHRVTDAAFQVRLEATVEGRFFVLRKGPKNYHLIRIL